MHSKNNEKTKIFVVVEKRTHLRWPRLIGIPFIVAYILINQFIHFMNNGPHKGQSSHSQYFFLSTLHNIDCFFSIAKAMTPLSHLCWEITQYDLTSSTSLLWAMNVWNCDLIKVGKTSNSKIKLNVESNQ